MEISIYKIPKMDCPSEENLIRMKLDSISDIKNLDFDLTNKTLTVYHNTWWYGLFTMAHGGMDCLQ